MLRPTSPEEEKEEKKESLLLCKVKGSDDMEKTKQRRELEKNTPVSDRTTIHSLSEFPVPTLFSKRPKSRGAEDGSRPTSPTSEGDKKESLYDKLPGSLKAEVLVKVKEGGDPEVNKQRQELIRAKTPNQLSQINSLSDFPVPSPIQHLFGG